MFTENVDKRIKLSFKIGGVLLAFVGLSAYFGLHPRVSDVGYRPEQPVPYSHKLHAGDLGIKCMYCHSSVESSAHSAVPSTSTCMNCHKAVLPDSPKLELVRESSKTGMPIEWRKVHKLPDYVNFNHSRHIRSGIDCASCHGEVETMGVVTQMQPLNMGWCLDCHRNPQDHVVPAREISGIFMGAKTYEEVAADWQNSIPTWGDGKWLSEKSFVPGFNGTIMNGWKEEDRLDPKAVAVMKEAAEKGFEGVAFASHAFEYDAPAAEGMFVPKKPSLGPENCGACHY